MSALPSIVRQAAFVSTALSIAGALASPALAQTDCRFMAGLPAAYAELAQTDLHAAPPVHPRAVVPGDPDQKVPVDPTVATHGQLLLGQTILYHLPVFMTDPWSHPHNFQVVLEVAMPDGAKTAIGDSQAAHPDSIHTAVPPVFAQTSLVIDVPGHPRKRGFEELLVFRNHFERPDRVALVRTPAEIVRVLHFRELAPDLPKPAELAYAVFGSDGEIFLSHLLSAPPDFDQILRVEIDGAAADLDMSAGWSLGFAARSNKVGDRLQVGEQFSCEAADGDTIDLRVVAEPYCEVGEFTHVVGEAAGKPFFGTPTPCPRS